MRRGAERLQSLACDVLSNFGRHRSTEWCAGGSAITERVVVMFQHLADWLVHTNMSGPAIAIVRLNTELSLPRHCARHVVCAIGWNRRLVGGPGFEPGASRSRTLRHLVQKCRKRSISVRIVSQGGGLHSHSGLFSCRITTRSTTPHRHQVQSTPLHRPTCCSQRGHRYFLSAAPRTPYSHGSRKR